MGRLKKEKKKSVLRSSACENYKEQFEL